MRRKTIENYFKTIRIAQWTFATCALFLKIEPESLAMSDSDYLQALKIADQKVAAQKKSRSSTGGALSASLLKNLLGRYYEVGDQWEVLAWHFVPSMMRMTSEPNRLDASLREAGVFRYQVIAIRTGIHPEVDIEVTQLEKLGYKPVDSKVESLRLTLSDSLVQNKKSYLFKNLSEYIPVSPEGIRSSITPLEFLPLDAPEIMSAMRTQITTLPILPEVIRKVVIPLGYAPDPAKGTWFESEDFFGRPVQLLWQRGDFWPSYLATPGGFAILLPKKEHT